MGQDRRGNLGDFEEIFIEIFGFLCYLISMTSPFSTIIGHERVLNYLERVFAAKKTVHAYLFEGAEHLGKRTVAEIFAGLHLSAEQDKLCLHPDFIFLELGINEKTGKIKKNIGIEEVREATRRLSLTPMQASSKVAIIDNAENLSIEAANALLKTLEEPAGQTHIILISEDRDRLPKTIVSRTQVIRFSPVKHELIENGLISRGLSREEAHEIAKASFGRPGLALNWSREKDSLRAREEKFKTGLAALSSSIFTKMKFVEKEIPDKGSGNKEKAFELLDMWELAFRDMLFFVFGAREFLATAGCSEEIASMAKYLNSRKIILGLRAAEEARAAIFANVSPRFAVENFLLKV